MIDIKQHLQPLGTNLFADVHRHFDPVTEIVRMPLHLDIDPGVEHFEANGDFLFLRVADDLFQALNHIAKPSFIGNAAAEPGEGDHVWISRLGRVIDALAQNLQAFGV